MKNQLLILAAVATLGITACKNRKIERIDPSTQTDLSGRWNDTDSRLVANEMITDALAKSWLSDWKTEKGKKPFIIVGTVRNKTHEQIDPETFVKDIERNFINSGLVGVVQAAEMRKEIRAEREDQQTYSSMETMKKFGREKGADFFLQGVITDIPDEYKNKKIVYYQIDLELTNLETNEKVWIGDKKIKKAVTN